jgi:hypothetical protein
MMKNNILKIIEELSKKEHFNGHKFSMSINFDKIIPDYNSPSFDQDSINLAIEKINEIDNIKNFNVTIKISKDTLADNFDGIYPDGWKTVQFIFYSGSDEEENNDFDTSKYGMYDFDTLGDRESFRITSKCCKVYHGEDGSNRSKYGNHFEYDKLSNLLDNLIELDMLLDKQYDEKKVIFDKLMMYF